MPVFLSCRLCGCKAVDGFLSRYAWGHVETNPHGTFQACPLCMEKHSDWEAKLRGLADQQESLRAVSAI